MKKPKINNQKSKDIKVRDLKAKKNPKAGTGISPYPTGPLGPGG